MGGWREVETKVGMIIHGGGMEGGRDEGRDDITKGGMEGGRDEGREDITKGGMEGGRDEGREDVT